MRRATKEAPLIQTYWRYILMPLISIGLFEESLPVPRKNTWWVAAFGKFISVLITPFLLTIIFPGKLQV